MPNFTITVPDIHQGTAFLWWGVDLPAPGTLFPIDNAGNPTGAGTPLGATEGAATAHVASKIEDVHIDQETAPVDFIMTAEEAYIECTLKESQLAKISIANPHMQYNPASGTMNGYAVESFTVGGLVTLAVAPVALISPRRGLPVNPDVTPGKFLVVVLYCAVGHDPFQIGFTRTKESMYKVRFTARALTDRPAGDRVAQVYRQVA